jgi:hypothetical protein
MLEGPASGTYSRQSDLEPGHVKHLGFAAGYGHLKYRLFSWQPSIRPT